MGTVTLAITNPVHNLPIVGAAADDVHLIGSVVHPAPGSLFYKWYSSLYSPADIAVPEDAPKAALNWPNHSQDALDHTTALSVGSQIITLVAKDVEGDGLADLQTVQEVEMAGGPEVEGVDNPCVIHVFKARIVQPEEGPPLPELSLSSSANVLAAEAPLKWGKEDDGHYVRDPDYHAINRVRYRWRFEPVGGGAPIGLPPLDATEAELAAFQEDLDFDDVDDPPVLVVRYTGSLPDGLSEGSHTLVLRVEDIQVPHDGDEASVTVTIVS